MLGMLRAWKHKVAFGQAKAAAADVRRAGLGVFELVDARRAAIFRRRVRGLDEGDEKLVRGSSTLVCLNISSELRNLGDVVAELGCERALK